MKRAAKAQSGLAAYRCELRVRLAPGGAGAAMPHSPRRASTAAAVAAAAAEAAATAGEAVPRRGA